VGNEYDGTISGVTEWGIYVEIEPTKVEGMVALRDIKDDFFIFDEKNYCVIGKSSRVRFTLGDKVRIRVSKVNIEQKLIDYELIWDPTYNKRRKKTSETRGSSTGKTSEARGSSTASTAKAPKAAKAEKAAKAKKASKRKTR
jgi:ribonuclease R